MSASDLEALKDHIVNLSVANAFEDAVKEL